MSLPFDKTISRRNFLSRAIGGIVAAIVTALGVPIVGYIISPARSAKKAEEWTEVGSRSDFSVGEPARPSFISTIKDGWVTTEVGRSVWVVRRGEEEFTVYNPKCTHLGCIVGWHAEDQTFKSPCHGGVFAVDGRVLAGPPPRPLDTLDWKIEDGKLFVVYKDFRLGISTKEEL